ncbi:MAG: TIGR03118 family protein, partial [Chloroflexi bacterium]
MRLRRLTLAIALATGLLSLSAIGAGAGAGKTAFTQTNLVSNRTDQGASVIDPSLQNPWGISAGPSTPMWVSDNGAGVTTLYRGDGSKVPLTVVIPPGAGSGEAQGTPTGTVFNGNGA